MAFECAAAAQPRPRIRWFRLAPPQGGRLGGRQPLTSAGSQRSAEFRLSGEQPVVGAAPFGSGTNNEQQLANSRFWLDESQLRSILLQTSSLPSLSDSFQRLEIVGHQGESLSIYALSWPSAATDQMKLANKRHLIPLLTNHGQNRRTEASGRK